MKNFEEKIKEVNDFQASKTQSTMAFPGVKPRNEVSSGLSHHKKPAKSTNLNQTLVAPKETKNRDGSLVA